MDKQFKTINEQEKILEDRGLIIDDHEVLNKVNYSHIIYNYGKLFWTDPKGVSYKKGTKMSNIWNLFLLNKLISREFYSAIGLIESSLKTALAKILSSIDPVYHVGISTLPASIYVTKDELDTFQKNLFNLDLKVRPRVSDENLSSGFVPIWLLVDSMAFGQLRMLLKVSGKETQAKILKEIGFFSKKDWKSMAIINEYRNLTHHYNPIAREALVFKKESPIKFNVFLKIIKIHAPEFFDNISNIINSYDFSLINISKDDLLDYFGVSKFF